MFQYEVTFLLFGNKYVEDVEDRKSNVDITAKERSILLCPCLKKVPIHSYNPPLLWQDAHCSIVSSNSFLS